MKTSSESNSKSGRISKNKVKQSVEHDAYLISLLDQISDALISTDLEYRVLEWNTAAENIYGWKAEEVNGRSTREFLQSEYQDTTLDEILQVLLEQGTWKGEVIQSRKDGTRFPAMTSVSVIRNKDGEPAGFVTINRDISDRKQTEEKVERQNKRLLTLREIDMAILSADSLENIVGGALNHIRELIDCRRANLTFIDWGTNEAVIFDVKTLTETLIPKGRRLPLAQYQDVIQTLSENKPLLMDDLLKLTDPRPAIHALIEDELRSLASLPLHSQGKLIGMLSVYSDTPNFFDKERVELVREVANQVAIAITQKQLTEELAKNEERLRLSLHAARQGLYDLNVQTGDAIVNREYAEMLGYDPETFVETNAAWIERLHPDDQPITAKAYADYVNGLLPEYRVEFRQKTKQGDWKWILSIGSIAEYDAEGKPLRMLGTHTDITESKEAEKRLTQMKRLYATLSQVNQTIVRVKDRADLYQSICDISVQFGEFAVAWVGLLNTETADVIPVASNGVELEPWPLPKVNLNEGVMKDGLVATAIRTSRVTTSNDGAVDKRLPFLQEAFAQHGFHSVAAIPFQVKGGTIGVLALISRDMGLFDMEEEVLLLKEMGGDISFALDMMENEAARKRAVEAQEEAHAKLEKLFDILPVGIAVLDRERKVIKQNPALQKILDLTSESLVRGEYNKRRYIRTDGTPMPTSEFVSARIIQGEQSVMNVETGIVKEDQSVIWTSVSGVAVPFSDWSAVIVTTDITERKQREKILRQWADAFEHCAHGIVIGDVSTNQVITCNPAFARTQGTTVEELIGLPIANMYAPQDREQIRQWIAHADRTGNAQFEANKVRKDGSAYPVQMDLVSVKDENGNLLYRVATQQDVSERKKAELQIQHQLQQLNSLHAIDQSISANSGLEETFDTILKQLKEQLGISAAAIFLVDEPQQLMECAACEGFRNPEVRHAKLNLNESYAGRAVREQKTLHIPNLFEAGGPLAEALKAAGDELLDYYCTPLTAKGKTLGVLEIYFSTPINPTSEWQSFFEMIAGQTAIAIENFQLLEGLKRSNEELEHRVALRTSDLLRLNAELEHANHTKDEFLANMSHELRTPLTGILGLSEALQLNSYGPLGERQIKPLKLIESSGRHLLELINDILDLSKIEAGKFDIYPEMIRIDETCQSSMSFIKEQAQKKSINLEYQSTKDILTIFADPRRLKQILVNLLSNAVKFTPENGEITLSVQTDPQKGQVHFSVSDSGIGISKEDLARLFTPFTQVDSSLNRQYQGTGLGLALVLRLAEMHGGSISVESEVNHGSRFTVSLPWQPHAFEETEPIPQNEQVKMKEAAEPNSRGLLLLADDNQNNIDTLRDYMEFLGYSIVVASNGRDALLKAEEHFPKLILMDVQMPVMDGLEAIRRLRADPRFISTPVIAITALAMIGDREHCLEAGANDYMSKPVRLTELAEMIEKLLQP